MKPLRVSASHYRTFEDLDLALPDGCVAVTGANGAGKSSIVNAIELALFAGKGELARHLADRNGGDLSLSLEFEQGGELYRVRRGYSRKGRGKTTLDFEHYIDGDREPGEDPIWESVTRETAQETQADIERTIGLGREAFRASAFLAQGDGGAFTEAAPKDRKRILAEVLGLDIYDQLEELARCDRKITENRLAELQGKRAHLEAIVQPRKEGERLLAEGERLLTRAEEDLRAARLAADARAEAYNQANLARATLAQARADHRAALAEFDTLYEKREKAIHAGKILTASRQALDDARQQVGDLEALAEAEEQLRQEVVEHARLVAERDAKTRERDLADKQRFALLANAENLEGKVERLRLDARTLEERGPGQEHCRECGQTLGAEALASAVASMRTQADDQDAAAEDIHRQAAAIVLPDIPALPPAPRAAELVAVQQRLRVAREASTQVRLLTDRVEGLEQQVVEGDSEECRTAFAAVSAKTNDTRAAIQEAAESAPADEELEAMRTAMIAARSEVEKLEPVVREHSDEVASLRQRMEQIAAAEKELADSLVTAAEFFDEVDLLTALEKAYGRDGIPALIVENAAAPFIETEASRILTELGGNTAECRIELRTQADLKSGEGQRDTLDIVIVGPQSERPYETYSGGERTRLNLALRIALARLLANRRGAESRLLVIDEPEFLDEAGVEKLAAVLRGLSGDFDKVVLISHVPALRESFDEAFVVVNEGGVSRIAA